MASAKQLRIGIGSRNYSYRRVAYELPVPNTSFRKVAYVPWRLLRRGDQRLANTYLFNPAARVDLFHLWNAICLNNQPWVTSFESHLPRFGVKTGRWYDTALQRLEHPSCCKLLALSDFARHFFIERNAGRLNGLILDKVEVFYGAVAASPPPRALSEAKTNSEEFSVVFVGHDFFRKGGVAVLRAFDALQSLKKPVKLAIVSGLACGDYVTDASPQDAAAVAATIQATPRITWHRNLSHPEVLSLIAASHALLLPTLDDTLGWVVLEAMASGVPVVGTNVCAMPEMLGDGASGCRIDLPLQNNRRWAGMLYPKGSEARADALEEAYGTIEKGILGALVSLCDDRDRWRRLSHSALNHVLQKHDAARQAARLRQIYCEAIR